jgi:hypothetical protein
LAHGAIARLGEAQGDIIQNLAALVERLRGTAGGTRCAGCVALVTCG